MIHELYRWPYMQMEFPGYQKNHPDLPEIY